MAELAMNRIRVQLRVRPPNSNERDWFRNGTHHPLLRSADKTPDPEKKVIIDGTNKSYIYDQIFREEATQANIFKECAQPILENVFAGYCGAILGYGQTGTGKTHTMQGYSNNMEDAERGIIPRSSQYLFSRIARSPDYDIKVTISFVQIYLDKLQDLFKTDAPEVNINPDTERVELPGITEYEVTSAQEFMKLFFKGEKNRVTRATLMNKSSSRGHSALIVKLRIEPKSEGSTKFGKLVLVDLAGYERFEATGITHGIAAEEAKKINASLLALGSVVNALADACSHHGKKIHIPYRNSKLTRLLKDCLGGTSQSCIILTMGPCDKYASETAGTLYFGWRAMAVKVDATIKEEYDPAKYLANLRQKYTKANHWIALMVKYWKRVSPDTYASFVQAHGEPEFTDDTEDGEEDLDKAEILAALHETPELAEPLKPHDDSPMRLGFMKAIGRFMRVKNARAKVDSSDPSAPKRLQTSKSLFKDRRAQDDDQETVAGSEYIQDELQDHQESAERQLQMLRLRHIQDIAEARAAGLDAEGMELLKINQEHEVQLLQEQHFEMRNELLQQKSKMEVLELLDLAKKVCMEGKYSDYEKKTVAEKIDHLRDTCETRDELMVHMINLIFHNHELSSSFDQDFSQESIVNISQIPMPDRQPAASMNVENVIKSTSSVTGTQQSSQPTQPQPIASSSTGYQVQSSQPTQPQAIASSSTGYQVQDANVSQAARYIETFNGRPNPYVSPPVTGGTTTPNQPQTEQSQKSGSLIMAQSPTSPTAFIPDPGSVPPQDGLEAAMAPGMGIGPDPSLRWPTGKFGVPQNKASLSHYATSRPLGGSALTSPYKADADPGSPPERGNSPTRQPIQYPTAPLWDGRTGPSPGRYASPAHTRSSSPGGPLRQFQQSTVMQTRLRRLDEEQEKQRQQLIELQKKQMQQEMQKQTQRQQLERQQYQQQLAIPSNAQDSQALAMQKRFQAQVAEQEQQQREQLQKRLQEQHQRQQQQQLQQQREVYKQLQQRLQQEHQRQQQIRDQLLREQFQQAQEREAREHEQRLMREQQEKQEKQLELDHEKRQKQALQEALLQQKQEQENQRLILQQEQQHKQVLHNALLQQQQMQQQQQRELQQEQLEKQVLQNQLLRQELETLQQQNSQSELIGRLQDQQQQHQIITEQLAKKLAESEKQTLMDQPQPEGTVLSLPSPMTNQLTLQPNQISAPIPTKSSTSLTAQLPFQTYPAPSKMSNSTPRNHAGSPTRAMPWPSAIHVISNDGWGNGAAKITEIDAATVPSEFGPHGTPPPGGYPTISMSVPNNDDVVRQRSKSLGSIGPRTRMTSLPSTTPVYLASTNGAFIPRGSVLSYAAPSEASAQQIQVPTQQFQASAQQVPTQQFIQTNAQQFQVAPQPNLAQEVITSW